MLSLVTVTLSPSSLEISSSAGAIIRHGPHHSAQKSTRTGPSAPNTSVAKLWSVTVLVAMAWESPANVKAIWAFGGGLSRHDFDQFWASSVKQRRAHGAAGKDHPKRLGISGHLRAMHGRDVRVARWYSPGFEIDYGDLACLD